MVKDMNPRPSAPNKKVEITTRPKDEIRPKDLVKSVESKSRESFIRWLQSE